MSVPKIRGIGSDGATAELEIQAIVVRDLTVSANASYSHSSMVSTPLIDAGKIKVIALLGPERVSKYPVVAETVPGVSATDFLAGLRPMQPRLYSIASSPKLNEGEVHLTVAAVRYRRHGRLRKGIASTFLAERVAGDGFVSGKGDGQAVGASLADA